MLKAFYALLALPLIPLAFAQAPLPRGAAAGASVDVGCEIRATKVSGGVQLEGVVFARKPAAGEYEFVVSKSGGGTSNTSQSGGFELDARQESVVGEVTLGGGGSAKARLTVRWDGGEASCSQ
jgi:hypothetical protein